MPAFELSPEDRESLVRYFIGSDRIPETADSMFTSGTVFAT